MDIPKGLIPARYIGNHAVSLPKGRRFYNTDGTLRTSLILEHGDELLMPDAEIIGQTILHDPTRQTMPQHLGAGHVVKPEHASLSPDELAEIGYSFEMGRTDFQAITVDTPAKQVETSPTDNTLPDTTSNAAISGNAHEKEAE